MEAGDLTWKFDVQANENTWSRAARRKRKRSTSPSHDRAKPTTQLNRGASPETVIYPRVEKTSNLHSPAALHCWLYAAVPPQSQHVSHTTPEKSIIGVTLETQWVRGKDRGMFEGFFSHVCRKITERLDAFDAS